MSRVGLLVVDGLCVSSVLTSGLFALVFSEFFSRGISPVFVPSGQDLITKLSSNQTTNILPVNSNLYPVSTTPIRAITKYLNNLLLTLRRQ